MADKTYVLLEDVIAHIASCERSSMLPVECSAITLIKNIPAADVIEVIRCGQCKYCVEHYDTDGNAPYWTCKEWDSGTDYDGYCHYGKRKEY